MPVVAGSDLAALYPQEYDAYTLPAQPALRALATALFMLRYRRALRRPPLRAVLERPAGRLLDIGSGRGDLGVVLGALEWEVTGLEPSQAAAAVARRRGVRTVVGTLDDTRLELAPPYDAVAFQHSLEHVAEPAENLIRARTLLKRGGVVLVTVPNFASWQARRFGSAWFHLDLPRHRSHFTARGLDALLARAGFGHVATSTSISADGLPMSFAYRLLGRSRGRGRGRYAEMVAAVLATPLTACIGRIVGDGDLLHAVAERT